jgi:hypothetical protein
MSGAYSRVFITGDIHGSIDIQKIELLIDQQGGALSADPAKKLMLVCGDFGAVFETKPDDWERSVRAMYRALYEQYGLQFATCLGNHENYDRIYHELGTFDWCGDKVYTMDGRRGPLYLQNGGYYTIPASQGDFTVLAMGGAPSADRKTRLPGKSWWPEEIPDKAMLKRALANLDAHDRHADYIVTHTLPYKLQKAIFVKPFSPRGVRKPTVAKMLQKIADRATWRQWFAGHHHKDLTLKPYKTTLLYNTILELKV